MWANTMQRLLKENAVFGFPYSTTARLSTLTYNQIPFLNAVSFNLFILYTHFKEIS